MIKLQSKDLIGLVPLIFGLAFAAGMFLLAVSITESSREAYKTKVHASALEVYAISLTGGKTQPKREKTLSEKFKFYEVRILLMTLPLTIFGLALASVTIGKLPKRNPLGLSDIARRGFLAMICLISLSTAIFLLYIWSLRVGLL